MGFLIRSVTTLAWRIARISKQCFSYKYIDMALIRSSAMFCLMIKMNKTLLLRSNACYKNKANYLKKKTKLSLCKFLRLKTYPISIIFFIVFWKLVVRTILSNISDAWPVASFFEVIYNQKLFNFVPHCTVLLTIKKRLD